MAVCPAPDLRLERSVFELGLARPPSPLSWASAPAETKTSRTGRIHSHASAEPAQADPLNWATGRSKFSDVNALPSSASRKVDQSLSFSSGIAAVADVHNDLSASLSSWNAHMPGPNLAKCSSLRSTNGHNTKSRFALEVEVAHAMMAPSAMSGPIHMSLPARRMQDDSSDDDGGDQFCIGGGLPSMGSRSRSTEHLRAGADRTSFSSHGLGVPSPAPVKAPPATADTALGSPTASTAQLLGSSSFRIRQSVTITGLSGVAEPSGVTKVQGRRGADRGSYKSVILPELERDVGSPPSLSKARYSMFSRGTANPTTSTSTSPSSGSNHLAASQAGLPSQTGPGQLLPPPPAGRRAQGVVAAAAIADQESTAGLGALGNEDALSSFMAVKSTALPRHDAPGGLELLVASMQMHPGPVDSLSLAAPNWGKSSVF